MLEKSDLLNTTLVSRQHILHPFLWSFVSKKRYYISGIYVKIIIIFPDRVYYICMLGQNHFDGKFGHIFFFMHVDYYAYTYNKMKKNPI